MTNEAPQSAADDLAATAGEHETTARWMRYVPVIAGLALLLALLGVGIAQPLGTRPPDLPVSGPPADQPAPDFTLSSFSGQMIRLGDWRGKPVVLNFWASWCAPCRQEAPALAKVAAANDGRVTFLGINVRDRERDARQFIATFSLPYPSAPDTAAVEQRYGIFGLPTTIFIRPDGTVARAWLGPLDERQLIAFIEELRAHA